MQVALSILSIIINVRQDHLLNKMHLCNLVVICDAPMQFSVTPRHSVSRRNNKRRIPTDKRRRHIECAIMRIVNKKSASEVAELMGKSVRTIQYWTKRALTYDCPEAAILRSVQFEKQLQEMGS